MNDANLNKVEVWIAEHSIRILAVLALLIAAGGFFVVKVILETGETSDKVTRIEPQVTTINRAICDARSLESEDRARRCAERIRVGLVNCRRYSRCRAAFIAALTYPPPARGATSTPEVSPSPASSTGDTGGGDAQNPHGAGQQPSPGSPGDNNGNGQGGQGKGQEPAPAPSPGASPAPDGSEAPEPSPGGDEGSQGGGGGAQGGQEGGSSSGAGVEVCVLERTCVDVEVGLDPKGLLP